MTTKINLPLMDQLLNDKETPSMPKVGDVVKVKILSVEKNEVYVDIQGVTSGLIRGRELVNELGQRIDLKAGDEIAVIVIDLENEKGLLELSLRSVGHQLAWQILNNLKEKKQTVEVKVVGANKGGLIVSLNNIEGFMPVSYLSKEHYPRVGEGNKNKILVRLKSLINKKLNAKIVDIIPEQEKVIFSEKEVYSQERKKELEKYKVGNVIEGVITGLIDFGVFIEFGQNLEGLIHISELSWQRINHPQELFKIGDKIKAQIISIDGEKITLSAKKLIEDPWKKAVEKYKVGQKVKGKILKLDNFGAFVELDENIRALAHLSELSDKKIKKPEEVVGIGKEYEFKIVSIVPEDHRLGLSLKEMNLY